MQYPLQPSPGLRTSKAVFDKGVHSTWTPTFTFVTPGNLSITYSVREGIFDRIGDIVICHFIIRMSSFTHTTAVGGAQITDLPYPVRIEGASGIPHGSGMLSVFVGITKANYTQFMLHSAGSLFPRAMNITAGGSGQAIATVETTNMASGGTPILQGHFIYTASLIT